MALCPSPLFHLMLNVTVRRCPNNTTEIDSNWKNASWSLHLTGNFVLSYTTCEHYSLTVGGVGRTLGLALTFTSHLTVLVGVHLGTKMTRYDPPAALWHKVILQSATGQDFITFRIGTMHFLKRTGFQVILPRKCNGWWKITFTFHLPVEEICESFGQSVRQSVRQSAHQSVRQTVPTEHLSVDPTIGPSARLTDRPFVCQSVSRSSIR